MFQAHSSIDSNYLTYSVSLTGSYHNLVDLHLLFQSRIKDSAFRERGLMEHLNGSGWLLQ